MGTEEYAKSFWSEMQKFNIEKIEKAKVAEIIKLLESVVTCKSWYTCEKCKGYKMSIALIQHMETNDQKEYHDNTH